MISRSRKTGNMSLASVVEDSDDLGIELGKDPRGATNSAHAAPNHKHNSSIDFGMLNKGIVVTNEVTITYTQEERIEKIIGF